MVAIPERGLVLSSRLGNCLCELVPFDRFDGARISGYMEPVVANDARRLSDEVPEVDVTLELGHWLCGRARSSPATFL